ncbi:MAG: DNA repair exonuclease [Beggiatoa sp. IS2]|nr:MAG: DNA repair exonuclease [Beggiatoa sp. IS2]
MKFIHAADIHLDSPLCGLARYEGAPVEQMQAATRRAFINLIDLACTEAVDFVLLAGDLYDGNWKDYNTGLFFNQQMSRLREANIRAFIVYGNHDAGNSITHQLRLPENVKEFSSHHPETFTLTDLGVVLHGQSFAEKTVTEDLSAQYPKACADYFNIGLLHTSVNGREGHAHYAPCTVSGLLAKGYDYWALGHVHTRETLHEKPWIVFPGNLQGRHVRETGDKGCTLVKVANNGRVSLQHCAVDVLRWEICRLDVSEVTHADEVIDRARWAVTQALQQADGRPLAVRFTITGACPVHAELHSHSERWVNEIRSVATDVGLGHVWVEKINLQTHAVDSMDLQEEGALGELVSALRALPQDEDILQSLSVELRSLKKELPAGHSIDLEHPETIRQALNGVKELLLARLLGQR